MHFNMNIGTFNVNNSLKNSAEFDKYNIDVSLNEISNSEESCQLKYGYVFSSLPKGITMSLEGTIEANGNTSDMNTLYQKDEQNIPVILRRSYRELYPILFMVSKSMNIPCPPYEINQNVGNNTVTNANNDIQNESQVESDSVKDESIKESQEDDEFESMSTEKLTQLQIDLSKEYSENPSEELKKKIDQINDTLNKKIGATVASTQNVS